MKRLFALSMIAIFFGLLLADSVSAIPAFSRKYGFNCNNCHTSFTKLNDWGQRYRDNGYQVMGQEGNEKNIIESWPPISMRTSTGASMYHSKLERPNSTRTVAGTTSGFGVYGFDLLASGVLHQNISFMLIYTPRIDEPTGAYNNSDASQPGALESVNAVFSNLVKDKLSLRVGRFEPAYHAISSKRSYYIMTPYEVYGFQTPGNSFVFDDNQFGLEATGHFKTGTHYGLGVVNGTGSRPDNNRTKDWYASVYQVFGGGEGQSAGYRVGGLGYVGWVPTELGPIVAPTGENGGTHNKKFYRLGLETSLNFGTFNVRGLFLHGTDDGAINPSSDPHMGDYKYNGGFVELDLAALPNNRLLASTMYNWVETPTRDRESRIRAFSFLLRYYLGDWTAVNVALHAEYTHRQTGIEDKLQEDQFTVLVDFDF